MFDAIDILINRAAVFEIIKDKRNYYADRKHCLDINEADEKYLQTISFLKVNICKKINSRESTTTTSKNAIDSVMEISPYVSRGPKVTSYVNEIINEEKGKLLKNLRQAKNLEEFKKGCAILSNNFIGTFEHPSGMLSFVQYTLKLSRTRTESFIAILSTGYGNNICTLDDFSVLKYLERAFSDDINNTILYPHIVMEEAKSLNKTPSGEQMGVAKADINKVKIHPIKTTKKEIFKFAGTNPPLDPQQATKETYEKKRSKLKSFKDLEKYIKRETLGEATVTIKTSGFVCHVPIDFFNRNIIPIRNSQGSGILFKDEDVQFLLDNINLFGEGKIKFIEVGELRDA